MYDYQSDQTEPYYDVATEAGAVDEVTRKRWYSYFDNWRSTKWVRDGKSPRDGDAIRARF